MANHSLNVNRDGQAQYKYLMDIGGESGTTWLSLNWKMATGALVFKVDTGSINWWYVCAAFPSATLAANAYHVLFLPLLPPCFFGGGGGGRPLPPPAYHPSFHVRTSQVSLCSTASVPASWACQSPEYPRRYLRSDRYPGWAQLDSTVYVALRRLPPPPPPLRRRPRARASRFWLFCLLGIRSSSLAKTTCTSSPICPTSGPSLTGPKRTRQPPLRSRSLAGARRCTLAGRTCRCGHLASLVSRTSMFETVQTCACSCLSFAFAQYHVVVLAPY